MHLKGLIVNYQFYKILPKALLGLSIGDLNCFDIVTVNKFCDRSMKVLHYAILVNYDGPTDGLTVS